MEKEKYEEYYRRLYRFVLLQVKNPAEAEDIVQEVFYQYIKAGISFGTEQEETAWLWKVAANLCRKLWRSAWYRKTRPVEEWKGFTIETAESAVLSAERQKAVLKEVQNLPIKYRQVVLLYYFEEMNIREMAKVLQRQESTIQTQLQRARELLGRKLEGEWR